MRPIYCGVIWFFIGMVGWVFFSVILAVGTAFGGHTPPLLWALMYLFGIAFFFSLPVAIVAEVVRWYRTRKHIKTPETEPSRLGSATGHVYCRQCGKQARSGSMY